MEKIITYDDLPRSEGESIYFRMETDPKLYLSLVSKGYDIVSNIDEAGEDTIYVTGRRQDYLYSKTSEYKEYVDAMIQDSLRQRHISKPKTVKFCFEDLIAYKYQIPFVLKNENRNGGKEKFLIKTEEDYENLIAACTFLIERSLMFLLPIDSEDIKYRIDYDKYLDNNFTVQEYIQTPTEYNTTVRLLTSPSGELLYGSLKYNEPTTEMDETTLLGYVLHKLYPLSTPSITSNTLAGGYNIMLDENNYTNFESELLRKHNIHSDAFQALIATSADIHQEFQSELGIICGFDYIYDEEKEEWYLLEYHSRPMVGDYSKRQGISYSTREDKLEAEGRVRATSLSKVLKKTR